MRQLGYAKLTGAVFALGGFTGLAYAHSPRQLAVSTVSMLIGPGLLMWVGWHTRR